MCVNWTRTDHHNMVAVQARSANAAGERKAKQMRKRLWRQDAASRRNDF